MPISTENTEVGLYKSPPFTLYRPESHHPVILVCEHASCYIPPKLQQLGLDNAAAREHIAWDIGALDLALALSERLNAPLLAAGYSRLLIDLNRPLAAPDSIPEHSEVYDIPGNFQLSDTTRRYRQTQLFAPFHQCLTQMIDQRLADGQPVRIVGVHSFTPVYRGSARPWEAGVLFGHAAGYANRLIDGLRKHGVLVGANEPYRIDPMEDMTVPIHGDERGLDAVLIEIRNDQLKATQDVSTWADRLAPWL
ncbi:N-formylglutamate amidohydrolase [Pseudomonas defluvii]|uniref:N-formylglutamate amidohydrolase n=1 Tax=Pseudomonas defluvii TaxID=1876757 RepID=UPI0008113DF6|nr:N-formylglutamate amidohydrolase [Pseudomonas defluvii]